MKEKEIIQYQIADVTLELQMSWKQIVSDAFRPFVRRGEACDWKIYFQPAEQLESFAEVPLFANPVFRVYEKAPGMFVRQYYNDRPDGTPYVSVCVDTKQKEITTTYLPEASGKFGSGEADFFCIAFEKILMEEQAMILHACCVDTPYGGILFSGHSGAGKSTQGDLWCKYGDAKLLNGDRPILKQVQEEWRAYGSPYAGSSGCHVDESCKIRALVFVKQAPVCSIRRLGGMEAFRKIFGNLTVNLWDQEFVSKAGEFAKKLAEEIPVYELSCTMEEDAVRVLKEQLERM